MQNHYIWSENINFTPIHRAESKWWIFHPGIEYPMVGFLSIVSLSWYNVYSLTLSVTWCCTCTTRRHVQGAMTVTSYVLSSLAITALSENSRQTDRQTDWMTERQTDRRADRKRTIPYKRKKLSTKWNGERWIKNVRGQRKEGWWNKSKSPFFLQRNETERSKFWHARKDHSLRLMALCQEIPVQSLKTGALPEGYSVERLHILYLYVMQRQTLCVFHSPLTLGVQFLKHF